MKEKLNDIMLEKTEFNDLDYVVREYLVHAGYQETFNSMEIDNNLADNEFERKLSARRESMDIDDDEHDNIMRKMSAEEQPQLRKRTLSLMMDRMGNIYLI